jgi:hypothetical protein
MFWEGACPLRAPDDGIEGRALSGHSINCDYHTAFL